LRRAAAQPLFNQEVEETKRMSTRPIQIIVLLAFVGSCLWGCAGPTKAGLEARANARERLNRVNARLSYDQARQAFEAGQFDKAAQEVKTAMRLHPDWAEYRVLEGRIHLETHRLEMAADSFEEALQLEPGNAEAHYYYGIVYQRWSEDDDAHDHYMAAYEMDPGNVGYLLAAAESMVALRQLDAAERLLQDKISYFEHNSAMHHLLAQISMLQDDPETAAALYSEARRLNPEDNALLEELAQAQYAAGQFGECYRSVKELQETASRDRTDLHLLEARCLTFMDELAEARHLYIELTRLRPTDPDVWIELGSVAWELGDYHRMALCGARVTALAPSRFEGYMLKGINERHHGNLSESVMYLKEAAKRSDDVALPHLILGRVYEQIDEPQAAMEAYAAAALAEPTSPEAKALFLDLSERLEFVATQEPDTAGNE
jgi:predicted Zn-dependent protease